MSNVIPRHAMILAAGLGTRMRPLTVERPKPLLEVAGKPLLDHVLDRVASAGIEEVIINCHYRAEQMITHLINRYSPHVLISHELQLLDSGGGVKKVLPWLRSSLFYVINADNIWIDSHTSALIRLAAQWNDATMDALLLLIRRQAAIGYKGKGDYDLAPDGRLTRRPRNTKSAAFVFSGILLTHPRLYRITPLGPFSNTVMWDQAEQTGRLFGLIHEGLWYHVNTPEALTETNTLLLSMQ